MFSVYRSSMFSIASTATVPLTRRVYHYSMRSLKISVNATKSSKAKVTAEKIGASATKTEYSSSSSWVKDNPFVFQLGVATVKTSVADLVAQIVAEKKSLKEVDLKRNLVFVVFGFAYLGGFQYWLMITKDLFSDTNYRLRDVQPHQFRTWFPNPVISAASTILRTLQRTMDRFAKLPFAEKLKDTAGIIDAVKMVLFDVIIHLPVIYFPTYYTVKEFVSGQSWNPADWVMDGASKYIKNSKEDLTAMIKLWGPSDCIQFVLPVHIRLPFRHIVSFFWTIYVSFTRGSIEDPSTITEEKELRQSQ